METIAAADLTALVGRLGRCSVDVSDTELIDLIAGLERVKNAAAAVQARAAVQLRNIREQQATRTGRNARQVGPAVAAEVALARRESPHRGAQLLGLAGILVREMPHTMGAFTGGEISEWRATLMARETACLSREHRGCVDAAMGTSLPAWSDRQIVAEARRIAYRVDPHSVVARASQAEADRRVTLRPAPDCMAQLSALLPVAQGVAVFASLQAAADASRAAGDARSKAQVMADTMVERVTGQVTAAQVPVEVHVVISDRALVGDSDEPARLAGHGPIPARVARRLAQATTEDQLWLRRLYSPPGQGRLVAMESTRRLFPAGLKSFIRARDEVCRTPWCGAPIRHIDHVIAVHAGGATTANNGQGLCERCNQVKEAPGWKAAHRPDDTVRLTTPTGHQHHSRPPDLPNEPAGEGSPLERRILALLATDHPPTLRRSPLRVVVDLDYAA